MAKSFVAFAYWIIQLPTPKTLCLHKLSFRKSKLDAILTFMCHSLATRIKCRQKVGSLAWYQQQSKRTILKMKLSPVWICWARLHKNSFRFRTIMCQPTMESNHKSSFRNRMTQLPISRQHAWMCWTFSSVELAKTLIFPKSSRNWAMKNSKKHFRSCCN